MEHHLTTYITHDTLISALGFGTPENLEAIRTYHSGITLQTDQRIADSPLLAATIPQERWQRQAEAAGLNGYTRMEQLFILAIGELIRQSGQTLEDKDCGLILSTTKGNIDLLARHTEHPDEAVFLWKMAENIAGYFHAGERVHVISNACISGVSALVTGKRMIESGIYRRVIIAGGDLLSHFITSGFLSFRSLSSRPCRPYDSSRDGLNLGEACGAVWLSTEKTPGSVILSGGAVSNDANHISGPSRTGDGLFFAIRQAMQEAGTTPQDISFVNAHGTATVYNDEMESKALTLAHLEQVPVHSLKPYFGHTLGASGIIESIICMHELKQGILFGTPGYETPGVPMPIPVYATHRSIPMKHCVKTASGFGGCNAALVLSLPEDSPLSNAPSSAGDCAKSKSSYHFACRGRVCLPEYTKQTILGQANPAPTVDDPIGRFNMGTTPKMIGDMQLGDPKDVLHSPKEEGSALPEIRCIREVRMENSSVFLDNGLVFHSGESEFGPFIREVYKKQGGNNMKFYKMDDLCKLGYVAAEYLLEDKTFAPLEIGMLLANAGSSLHTDIRHQQLIDRDGDEAASPATFVYTLPNVVSGEICIRHKIQGENTFFIAKAYQPEKLEKYARIVMKKGKLKYCIIGWCELLDDTYKADFKLIEIQ